MTTATENLSPARVTLGVADLDRTEAFYRDALGLAVLRESEALRVRVGDFELVLETAPPAERGKFLVGFRVASASDVDAWAGRLRSAGVPIIAGPANDREGHRTVIVTDPDDYRIEIFS